MQNPVIPSVVDQLAAVNAQIKALQDQADVLKQVLVAQGPGSYASDIYKAVVSEIEDSVAVNYKQVAEYLAGKVSAQVYGNAVKKASKIKPGYIRVSLYDL